MIKKYKRLLCVFLALIMMCMTPYRVYAESENTVDVYPYIEKAVNKLDKLDSFKYTVSNVYGDGEELRCTIYNGETANQYIEVINNYPVDDGSGETCFKYIKHDSNKWAYVISEENFKKNLDSIPFENWTTTHQDEYGNAVDIPSLGKSGYRAMILYQLVDEEKYFANLTNEYVKEHKDEIGEVDAWTKSFNKEAKKFRKACKKGVITKTKKGKLYTVLMKSGNQTVNFSFNVDKKGRLTSYLVNNVVNYEFYSFK